MGSQGEARSCGHPGGSVRAGSASKAMRNSRTATVQGTCWCGVHAYAGGSVRYARLYAGKVRMARPFRYSWAKGPRNRRHPWRETVPAPPFATIATADMRRFAKQPLTRVGGGYAATFFSHTSGEDGLNRATCRVYLTKVRQWQRRLPRRREQIRMAMAGVVPWHGPHGGPGCHERRDACPKRCNYRA